MVWLQNLVVIAIGFLLSRILVEERIHTVLIDRTLSGRHDLASIGSKILLVSYGLSLFFPNTIVVITMIPIVKLIVNKVRDTGTKRKIGSMLGLALIYGSNIGGMGSMIGASSNLFFLGYIELRKIPGRENISFFTWLLFGIPLTLILLMISRFVLKMGTRNLSLSLTGNQDIPQAGELNGKARVALGRFTRFLGVNILLILLFSGMQYICSPPKLLFNFNAIDLLFILYLILFILFGMIIPKGRFRWSRLFRNLTGLILNILLFPLIFVSELINEVNNRFSAIQLKNPIEPLIYRLFNAIWLRLFREKIRNLKRENSYAYISVNRIFYDLPYLGLAFMGIVILLLYLVLGIGNDPATSEYDGYLYLMIKQLMGSLITTDIDVFPLLVMLVLASVFLTEIVSNTTIILLLFSILDSIAPEMSLNPLFLMLAVTVASTAAFMSPIASPVNAVAYASIRELSLREMLIKGGLLNLLASLYLLAVFWGFHTVFHGMPG